MVSPPTKRGRSPAVSPAFRQGLLSPSGSDLTCRDAEAARILPRASCLAGQRRCCLRPFQPDAVDLDARRQEARPCRSGAPPAFGLPSLPPVLAGSRCPPLRLLGGLAPRRVTDCRHVAPLV